MPPLADHRDAAPMHSPVSPSPAGVTPIWRRALDNPWFMLAMLFFVTAALGIPFLWMSRGFSGATKVVLTIVVLVWTAVIFWLFWLVMVWSWTRVSDSLGWS